jgi:hypothetical protein
MPQYGDKYFKPPTTRRSALIVLGGFTMAIYFEKISKIISPNYEYEEILHRAASAFTPILGNEAVDCHERR